MPRRQLALVFALLILATAAQAQWVSLQATNSPADANRPSLASSPEGITVMGFSQSGDPLLQDFVGVMTFGTMATDYLVLPDPIILTSGSSIEVCYSRTGFYAAVNSGLAVLIYHADEYGVWESGYEAILFPGGDVVNIDLYGVHPDAAGPDVFLAVEIWDNPPHGPHQVKFASHSTSGWTDFELVADTGEYQAFPQITWSLGPAGPWPQIFYHDGNPEYGNLKSRIKDLAAGWMDPVSIDNTPIAMEFDVVTYGMLEKALLGVGVQPTCPCNQVFHQGYLPGDGWGEAEHLTVNHADYDWPMGPKIAVDNEDRLHAFWYQEARAHDFTFYKKTLEYFVFEDGQWNDQGDFLDPPPGLYRPDFGSRVAVTAEPGVAPVLAWSRRDTIDGVPQPEQVHVSRIFNMSDVPDDTPRLSMDLEAWPNPFNPRVKIAFSGDITREVRVDVFDARGRHVNRLLDTVVGSGRTVLEWNGSDETGRRMPSGVYFARVISGREKSVTKLVLAE